MPPTFVAHLGDVFELYAHQDTQYGGVAECVLAIAVTYDCRPNYAIRPVAIRASNAVRGETSLTIRPDMQVVLQVDDRPEQAIDVVVGQTIDDNRYDTMMFVPRTTADVSQVLRQGEHWFTTIVTDPEETREIMEALVSRIYHTGL